MKHSFHRKLYITGILLTVIAGTSFAQDPRVSVFADGHADLKATVPTLNDFLLRRHDALLQLQNLPDDQLKPVTLEARTTAEQRSGIRRIRIRGFQIESDSGPDYAGYNIGPSSPESAQAVLASDIADAFLSQAALKGIRLDALDVTIASRPDRPGTNVGRVGYPRNLLYTAYIVSPATDEQLEELRLAAEASSSLFNLVSEAQIIKGDIDYTQTPEELVIPAGYQPGLREYLKHKRNAYLYKEEQAKQRAESRAKGEAGAAAPSAFTPRVTAHVNVEGGTGVRRVHIRQFEILHDNPAHLAGNDLGPSAQEHQLGVLTSCITHIFLIQAAARQVTLDSLEVSVNGVTDLRAGRPGFESVPRYPHNISYTVHIKSPATFDEIKDLRDAVEAVCPIYNLLKDEQEIEGKIVRGRYKTE
ncbi:OsmC-like protein [Bacteroidales bacterium Barb6XT]|nr:OsmC-like protein [Bacteroidales bacterium Barb6XT]